MKKNKIDEVLFKKRENEEDDYATQDIRDLRMKAYMEEVPELKKIYKEEYEKAKDGMLVFIGQI